MNKMTIEEKIKDIMAGKTNAVEKQPRINPELLGLLNQQIKNELYSAQVYFHMAGWADNAYFTNICKYMMKNGNEEISHMNKIYEYLFDRNVQTITPAVEKCGHTYTNLRALFEAALTHEIGVTANWDAIANKAKSLGDNMTYNIALWFVSEQKEEEAKFRDILFKMNIGTPDWMIEESFK